MVETRSTSWATGPAEGGYLLNLTLTNVCEQPVPVWELLLGLAPEHTATQGWNAQWSLASDPLVATKPPWLPALDPGGSITIGLLAAPTRCASRRLPARLPATLLAAWD